MRRRSGLFFATLLASCALTTSASAMKLRTPTGALLAVHVVRAACPIITAHEPTSCTTPDGHTIYLAPDLGPSYQMIRWHEVAHALYFQGYVTRAVQARFRQLGAYPATTPWMADLGASLTGLPTSLEELYAESYSYCVTTARSDWGDTEPFGEFGWDPPRKQRVQTCDMLYRNIR
jgi:hypothetical protein